MIGVLRSSGVGGRLRAEGLRRGVPGKVPRGGGGLRRVDAKGLVGLEAIFEPLRRAVPSVWWKLKDESLRVGVEGRGGDLMELDPEHGRVVLMGRFSLSTTVVSMLTSRIEL